MNIDELARDILKKEDDQLARAFTMVIGSLLTEKGIQPILNKSEVEWNENDDLNKYIIRREYNVTFDIDTTEHDAKVRAHAIDEFQEWLKTQIVGIDNQSKEILVVNGDRWELAIDEYKNQLKEQKND